jgi:hypothetical protein
MFIGYMRVSKVTLYRHVDLTGHLRPDGEKLLKHPAR